MENKERLLSELLTTVMQIRTLKAQMVEQQNKLEAVFLVHKKVTPDVLVESHRFNDLQNIYLGLLIEHQEILNNIFNKCKRYPCAGDVENMDEMLKAQ